VEQGIANRVHLHAWIPYHLMPDYLSLGSLTLCIGNFVEAFGNVRLESIACGTPALVTNVAAHADSVPDTLIPKLPFGQLDAIAEAALNLLLSQPTIAPHAREFLNEHFSFARMVESYERLIVTSTVEKPLPIELIDELGSDSRVRLAAWCRDDAFGIYHDYQYRHYVDPKLVLLARSARQSVTVAELTALGFTHPEILSALEDGVLVQLASRST
jgi:hypothetical protein